MRRKQKAYRGGHRGGTEGTEKGGGPWSLESLQREKAKDLAQRAQRGAEKAEKGAGETLGTDMGCRGWVRAEAGGARDQGRRIAIL